MAKLSTATLAGCAWMLKRPAAKSVTMLEVALNLPERTVALESPGGTNGISAGISTCCIVRSVVACDFGKETPPLAAIEPPPPSVALMSYVAGVCELLAKFFSPTCSASIFSTAGLGTMLSVISIALLLISKESSAIMVAGFGTLLTVGADEGADCGAAAEEVSDWTGGAAGEAAAAGVVAAVGDALGCADGGAAWEIDSAGAPGDVVALGDAATGSCGAAVAETGGAAAFGCALASAVRFVVPSRLSTR